VYSSLSLPLKASIIQNQSKRRIGNPLIRLQVGQLTPRFFLPVYLLQLRPCKALELLLGAKVLVDLAKCMAFVRERCLQIVLYPRSLTTGLRSAILAISYLFPVFPPQKATPMREHGNTGLR